MVELLNEMESRKPIGTYAHTIKEYDTWNGHKNTVKDTKFFVVHFNPQFKCLSLNKYVTLDAVQLNLRDFELYIDKQAIGPHGACHTLRPYFEQSIIDKINNTLNEIAFELTCESNVPVYVSKPWLDDPIIAKQHQAMQNYWKANGGKFEKYIDDNMSTKTAFFKTIELENEGETQHIKARISNVKAKTVNVDISTIVTDVNGKVIQIETYVETIHSINKETLAYWFVSNGYLLTSIEPTTTHFEKA